MRRGYRGGLIGLMLAALLGLAACHDGNSSSDSQPPDGNKPPASAGPTASFTAIDSVQAGTPVIFDAAGSTSGDGSALQYSWSFGNGQRGGGKTIARAFAAPATITVTLTVLDGAGRSATRSKSLSVTAAPRDSSATVTAEGSVTALDGTSLEGVLATPFGASQGASSDASGKVRVSVSKGAPLLVKLTKGGYADQFVPVKLPATAGADAYFDAVMRPRDATLTLADAAAGGSLTARDGASITLPANALVDASNAVASGAVQIAMTPVDVTQPGAGGFPGSFDGIKPDGSSTPIVSFGTTEYVLAGSDGRPLQLAPGKTATIEVPLYATLKIDGTPLVVGDTTPLWSLDETTGIWVQEGTGTVVASSASPTGLAMRATVSHFSWWNSDIGFDPYGPKPKCIYDTDIGIPGANDTFATATICNMLAEIDRNLGGAGSGAGAGRVTAKAAEPLPPRVAGFSRRAQIPIEGGIPIPVPANVNIALSASALNGTWVGNTVVSGPVGELADVLIKMHPLQSSGPGAEGVTLPFDSTRALDAGQTARFQFAGSASRYVRITVSPGNGSTLAGSVRLLQGSTVLGTQALLSSGATPIVSLLPAASPYIVEVTSTANVAAAYRLQIELIGSLSTEAVTVPFDVTRALPDYTVQKLTFDVASAFTGYIAFQKQLTQSATASLLGPGGVLKTLGTPGVTDDAVLSLAPGAYSLLVSSMGGLSTGFRTTLGKTSWEQVGTPLEGITSIHHLVDLIPDRNGAPVVGYIRTFVAGGHNSAGLNFKRWTGTAWESIGSELVVDWPCSDTMVSFAFDSANAPIVAYGNNTGTESFTSVRRLDSGAWTAVGPSDGKLPNADAFGGACNVAPIVQVGADDRPVVAYIGGGSLSVLRFDGAAWGDLVPGAATFPSNQMTFELRADASGRIWFVTANPAGIVRRFRSTPTPAWETIGASGGALPDAPNTVGLESPHIRFDAQGNPFIGATAYVSTTPGVSSSGVMVYRFDGANWSTTGGYQTGGSNPYSAGSRYVGFALLGGEPIVSWLNNTTERSNVAYVQKNTASGWTAVGTGNGEIPQFAPLGITQRQAWQTRLATVGTDLYAALTVSPTGGVTAPFRIYLLKKTAN